MLFSGFLILAIQKYEISDIVGKNRSLIVDRVCELFRVGFSRTLQLQDMER